MEIGREKICPGEDVFGLLKKMLMIEKVEEETSWELGINFMRNYSVLCNRENDLSSIRVLLYR